MSPSKKSFASDVARTMNILVHSLYREREIFLRELISNAVDAINRLRIIQMTADAVSHPDLPLDIRISLDADARTLTVQDSGCGMTEAELVEHLGTIAHSGSRSFIQSLNDSDASRELIGQFGVGFYSVFMVADHVTVTSRSWQADAKPATWISDGSSGYETDVLSTETEWRGTRIVLHLREDASEYLDPERIRTTLARYSRFVSFPVLVNDAPVERAEPLWMLTPATVKEEQYRSFYGYLAGGSGEPMTWVHIHSDAPVDLKAILYVPGFSLARYGMEDKGGVALYSRKVLIDAAADELVPEYLRFVRGLADSEDIDLNVSRETVQNSPVFRKIRAVLTGKVIKHLAGMLRQDRDQYRKFFEEFGNYLKEGVIRDPGHRVDVAGLLMFHVAGTENMITLDEYLDRTSEAEHIYYIAGADRKKLETSPHLEYFREKNIPVLILPRPLDELVLNELGTYRDADFLLASHRGSEREQPDREASTRDAFLLKMEQLLKERVKGVRYSNRLVKSPYCLVTTSGTMSPSLEEMMHVMNENFEPAQRILELNPEHELVRKLKDLTVSARIGERLALIANLIVDSAMLLDHQVPPVQDLVHRIDDMMVQMMKVDSGNASGGQSDGMDLASN